MISPDCLDSPDQAYCPICHAPYLPVEAYELLLQIPRCWHSVVIYADFREITPGP